MIEKSFKTERICLAILVFGLAIFGLLMVYSASRYTASVTYKDEFLFLKKQAVGVGIGVVGFIFFSFFDYQQLKKFAFPLVVLSVILLVLVFVPKIGVENYGAKRWINVGFFTIQPSEIAKFALILFSAKYIYENKEKTTKLLGTLPMLAVGGVFCVLVLLEPNLSITVCMGLLLLTLLIIGGLKYKWLLGILLCGLTVLPILILVEPYRLQRLIAFLDPWATPKGEGYQLIQSLYAIANGGLFGVGYLNSRQALKFLPFAESDFIFSIIAEEFGLFGCILTLLAFISIVYIGVKIAINCKNRFAMALSMGISMLIALQVMINVAVVTGSIPPTGLPLPFISSGNTQIIMFMSECGIIYNIGKMKI